MASQLTIIATDLRRTTLKVTPNTYLIDVLQDGCKKLNLDSGKYLLKSNKKTVDLSLTVRNSGLPAGAKLELVLKSNSPSVVTVGLQLPPSEASIAPNGRLSDKFPSDFTLWKVLRQFESGKASLGKNLNITGRGVARTEGGKAGSGQLYYETPILNIVGRELASFVDFQKTLSQLGYNSGSVLLRLSYRPTEQTLFAAMEEIGLYFQEEEKAVEDGKKEKEEGTRGNASAEGGPSVVKAEATSADGPAESNPVVSEPTVAPQLAASSSETAVPSSSDAMEVDSAPSLPSDPLRPVHVYSAPTSSTPAAARLDVSDTDYTPTVAHAQLHQARLQQSAQNKRLLSDQELEQKAQAEESKLAAVTSVDIRVRFPDNSSAQWRFGTDDTAATLYKAVRSVMAHPDQTFRLHAPASKGPLADDDGAASKLIRGLRLKDKVLVNLTWDDAVPLQVRKERFLAASVAGEAKDVPIPDAPSAPTEDEGDAMAPVQQLGRKLEKAGEEISKKMPKWLKLGGKK